MSRLVEVESFPDCLPLKKCNVKKLCNNEKNHYKYTLIDIIVSIAKFILKKSMKEDEITINTH